MAEKNSLLKKLELKEFPQPEIVQLNYPVFFCHGFGGLAAVIKSGPMHDPCMLFRKHGIVSIAPNIVPYARIETRAENWVRLIKKFCKDFGCDKMNIIAHSMGGLDMRYAISKLGIADKVESLTTVSTPHRGSSLANLVLEFPELITDKLIDVFDWFGDNIYTKTKSDVLGSLEQLTREYVENEFNPSAPDVETVKYYSYSAAVGKGTNFSINPVLKYQNNQIYERDGVNDAFVSTVSAKWGEHIETIRLSHLLQMRLQVGKEGQKLYEEFWFKVMKMLSDRGH